MKTPDVLVDVQTNELMARTFGAEWDALDTPE